jgi:G-protein signaling modulator 2
VQQNNNANVKDQKRLLEMIADFQSKRMDEQRCELLPGYKRSEKNSDLPPIMHEAAESSGDTKVGPDEPFFDMLMRSQSSRYDEQRSELPKTSVVQDVESNDNTGGQPRREGVTQNRTTLPDEDFFSLIMRVQGGRMEDQRATVPLNTNRNQNSNNK